MEENYNKAYKEVIEILKYLPQESVDKIPKKMIETFENKMDKNYIFNVDKDKNFGEQNLLEETKDIFAIIFRDYWATPVQRKKIKEKEYYDRKKLENQKKKRYHNDIFQNNKPKKEANINNTQIVEYKEKTFLKLLNKIKKILHII